MKFQTPYERIPFKGLVCGKSMTKQSFKDECDIHTIIDRFKETGQVPQAAVEGQYGDFSGVQDYHEAMLMVTKAQTMFEALPADVRDEFKNDPGRFVEFVENASNEDLVKRGLAVAPEPTGEHLSPEGTPAPAEAASATPEPAEGATGGPGEGAG